MFYEKYIHCLHVEETLTQLSGYGLLQTRCRVALGWIQEAGVTLNKDKCELNNTTNFISRS